MSRRKLSLHKPMVGDPTFQSILIEMLTNRLLKKGKKSLSVKLIYQTLDMIQNKTHQDSLSILDSAIQKLKPSIEIQTKRIGGAVYSVPIEIHSFRSTNLAIQLLLTSARKRSHKYMYQSLAEEIIDASKNMGTAIRKKEEMHNMVESTTKLTKK